MRKGTLARFEIYLGLALFAGIIALAGYGLVSALADRIDPKVRDCIDHTRRLAERSGKPVTHDYAAALCRRLESVGAL
jgi:protein-disulfide isomerase-like protein with CxxC motif